MIKTLFREWQAKLAFLIFFVFTIWWLSLQLSRNIESPYFDYFASTYCIMAIWGGFWGIKIAQKWGGYKSIMGKAIIFFSLGLFAQAFGQLAYSYYVMIKQIEVPYPSIGDLGYFGSIPLYIAGISYLAHASGISISLRSFRNQIAALVLPALILIVTYLIFLKDYTVDWSNPLTVLLDFGYPLGQSIYIAFALLTYLLSRSILGGKMKKRVILILLALCVQYCADFVFLYQANTGTWLAGGINDFMYFFGYFIMALGLLQLCTVYKELRTNSN